MASQGKLRGIFTPNIVPLDARGEINELELRRYTSWLIDHGVHGLYPNGSTGEFTRFTPEERRRIIEIMADEAAGRVPILAGAWACEPWRSWRRFTTSSAQPMYMPTSRRLETIRRST
jgi:4-hydroxy-tetrahydrodipicolinate synthase